MFVSIKRNEYELGLIKLEQLSALLLLIGGAGGFTTQATKVNEIAFDLLMEANQALQRTQ